VTIHYDAAGVTVHHGDCREVLADLPAESVDAIVTDPPYELGFMSKSWDSAGVAFDPATWEACLRVLRPGGHLLAFGGTRTYHRLTVAIEDAGFEVRDSLHWIYGSGFPKSLDVGKAIDKAAGATREVVGLHPRPAGNKPGGASLKMSEHGMPETANITAPATDDARRWQGWGTALKPAHEPIVLARKPLGGTVAASVLAHGTGALNVDGCRVEPAAGDYAHPGNGNRSQTGMYNRFEREGRQAPPHAAGRWPTNVVLSHPPALDAAGAVVGDACAGGCVDGCPVAEMDAQSGVSASPRGPVKQGGRKINGGRYGSGANSDAEQRSGTGIGYADTGGASRFFPVFRYQAKAPKAERPRLADGTTHPTVKPLALMRWLVRLVTPGGTVLDPFLGSGTTAQAAALEGFRCIGVESEPAHLPLITARLAS
jgi:hypothetical protein